MKLFTVCKNSESLYDLKASIGVKLQEYSVNDFYAFYEKAKKHYICRRFYWYETDMSDSDSGTIYDLYPINHTNMVIKDNSLYGVLVKTRGMFPEYRIVEFSKCHKEAALGGGYNKLDYDWWIKDNDKEKEEELNVSSSYVLLCEYIGYQNGKISSYMRDVVGFLPNDCIIENGCVVGLKYKYDKNYEFIFKDADSLTNESVSEDGDTKSVRKKKLVKIDGQLLEKNIFDVTWDDFKKGRSKPYNI